MRTDDKKKKDEKKPKISITNPNTVERAAGFGSRAALYEPRNAFLILNKEEELEQVVAELAGYAENKDTSIATDIQTNQGEILKEVSKILKDNKDQRGIFEAVKTLFSKKDIKWTDQLTKIGLRLIRLYELQRTGTTDIIGFSEAKDMLKERESDLLKFHKGGEERARLVLKNVQNSRAGTAEIGLEELEETRGMVQSALKDELVGEYQKPADPQTLEGPQGDIKIIKTDVSPKIVAYLRLYESLSIAIIKQQEITRQKEIHLAMERERAMAILDSLARAGGVVISEAGRDRFMDKVSVMDLHQIDYFCTKAEQLRRDLRRQAIKPEEANAEINSWLEREFTRQELHEEKEKTHEENLRRDEKARGQLINIALGRSRKPVPAPVEKEIFPQDIAGRKKTA